MTSSTAPTLAQYLVMSDAPGPHVWEWRRRVRILLIAPSMLLLFIGKPDDRARITSEGLPDDARFVGAYYDDARDLFRIHVASATFEEVPPGVMPPELEVTFTAHYAEREQQ